MTGLGGLRSFLASLGRAGGTLAPAPLSPGEALLFDARRGAFVGRHFSVLVYGLGCNSDCLGE